MRHCMINTHITPKYKRAIKHVEESRDRVKRGHMLSFSNVSFERRVSTLQYRPGRFKETQAISNGMCRLVTVSLATTSGENTQG